MIKQKSYSLYNPFLSRATKSNQNRTFFSDHRTILKSDKLDYPSIKLNNMKRVNSYKSFKKTSLDYKFYKLLKKNRSVQKNSNFFFPNIIDKSPFNFNLKDEEAEIIKKIKNINKGNKKHRILSELAFKKETQKRKNIKEFMNEMKLYRINIKLVKKQNIEEKKKKKEILNLQIKKMKKLTHTSFDSMDKGAKSAKNKYKILTINNLFDKERKLIFKRDKLMHRFHEIMNKLKVQK